MKGMLWIYHQSFLRNAAFTKTGKPYSASIYRKSNSQALIEYAINYTRSKIEFQAAKGYLLTWNPNSYEWDEIDKDINEISKNGFVSFSWTCMSTKPKIGDQVFIVFLGTKYRGIVASGYVDSIDLNEHSEYNKSGKTNIVNGKLTILLNPKRSKILELEILREMLPDQVWNPRQSGIQIRPESLKALNDLWTRYIEIGEISEEESEYSEGRANQIMTTRYERNVEARNICISHYGYKCSICNMVFEAMYGEVGKGFIHVHHISFISDQGELHTIDPIEDLATVCPNCHAMLHRKINGKYLSIIDIKSRIKNDGNCGQRGI
jgi:5-methylcytosine-specific restriction protein A